jgi:hypothetical protein
VYSGPVDPKVPFKNQIHDFDPGNAEDGLFWTLPISLDSVTIDVARRVATLSVKDQAMPDFFTIPNALMHGKSQPATVSYDLTWTGGAGQPERWADLTKGFHGDFMPATVTGTWSGRTQGFEFVADAADAIETRFAAVGYEQNGSFAYTGHLNRNGGVAEYSFDYPGDESVYTIGLQVYPDVGAFMDRAGFRVYNPNGAVHVTGGPQGGLVPNVAANVISRNKGRHLVQVYNYHPEAGLDYALTLTPGPPESSRR